MVTGGRRGRAWSRLASTPHYRSRGARRQNLDNAAPKDEEQTIHMSDTHVTRLHIRPAIFIGGVAALAALIGMSVSSYSQTPADDVSAQIRDQGYRCDRPVAAVRDVRRSKPDSAVWVLSCRNARYRVRLDPGMAARVTKLKKKSD